MAKKKKIDITKFAGCDWDKQKGAEPFVEVVDTCTFCAKGIKETEDYWTLQCIEEHEIVPSLVACTKCAISAGCEW